MNEIRDSINSWSNSAGVLFLCLLLATFMNEHINAVRNIALYSLAIMVVLYFVTCRWNIRKPDAYHWVLILLTLVIAQGVVRNEYGVVEGLDDFRKTYFKSYMLAIGMMLFVSNVKTISMVIWSLIVAAVGVVSNAIYLYVSSENVSFYYWGESRVRHYAHQIDFIDPVVVAALRHNSHYLKYLAAILFVVLTILVVGIGTRGGWLAFAAGFITTYFVINYKNGLTSSVAKAFSRLAVVVAGIYLLAPSDSVVHNKFTQALDSKARVETIYPTYFDSVIEGPLLGYSYTRNIEDRIPNIIGADPEVFEKALYHGPHNQFLIFGVHFGLLGMIVYIVVILWTLFRLVNRAIGSSHLELRLLSAAGAGMLMAEFIVRSMTDPVFKTWIGVPIGIALIKLNEEKTG